MQYYNHVVDIDGLIIPLSDIKTVSFNKIDTVEGMLFELGVDNNSINGYNCLYIVTTYGKVCVVDFSAPNNKLSYDSDYNRKAFIETFVNFRNNACKCLNDVVK